MGLGGSAMAATPVLSVDVGTIYLQPNLSGQVVELSLSNEGASAAQVQGLNLRLEVDDGLGGANAPIITDVDPVTGSLWDGKLGSITYQEQEAEYWDVRLLTDFFGGEVVEFGPGSLTRMALVELDTTGLTSGSWSLRLSDHLSRVADTKYTAYQTVEEWYPAVINGQLVIVPEPGTYALLGAGGLLAWAGLRRCRRQPLAIEQDGADRPGASDSTTE
ncbi:MAG: PEP-CTERM sorting domain-containing protein [Verrucomicrobiae bacterium]|nr:PEP-CTERM sorting domain-containing protein [Verrucomicrobiae bacterium]